MTTCYLDRVETGPYIVPGLQHFVVAQACVGLRRARGRGRGGAGAGDDVCDSRDGHVPRQGHRQQVLTALRGAA